MSLAIKCIVCGTERKISPSQKGKKYCGRSCYALDMKRVASNRIGRTSRKTHEQFLEEVKINLNDEYDVVGRYVNNRTRVEAIHKNCGKVVSLSPKDLLKGVGCFSCGKKKAGVSSRVSKVQFSKEFTSMFGDDYTQLTEYVTNRNKIKVRHERCGSEFSATPNNLLSKSSGCPVCKQSKGEEKVSRLLTNFGVDFDREVRMKDCSFLGQLRFDFAVKKDEEIVLLIEYDGIQHFQPIDQFGGTEGFEKTKTRDKVKDEYCRENGIPLLRLPYTYTDDDIYKFIQEALDKCFFVLPDKPIPSQPEMETSGSV